jgi:NADH-quinone oxidoreductase subunit L
MFKPLWLVPVLPLVGFLLLVLGGRRWSRAAVSVIGVGTVGLSAVAASLVAGALLYVPQGGQQWHTQTFWTWIAVGDFAPRIAFRLDALSCVMMLVVTWVGFLIHLYSTEYMRGDEGYRRFFAYMNLFVASMLTLVLADDLLLLYLGWEGVGLCSYLLIGFWYADPSNGRAARKAFIVTRVGDTAMAIGLLLLFRELHTLSVQDVMSRAAGQWAPGAPLAVAAAALLLAGAVGKSAQLPLQTWLPDAMAGPTPVSALIHAATMVTAGMYLIARMNVLFTLAPDVQTLVAAIGAATLLLAGCSALVQRDIKRVLAYSTISQIGYMFVGLGAGAWSAAIFHFVTHAFFKALLFLAAGGVILAMHHEQDMFRMGGLRRKLPVVFWTFLIGGASLSALPLVTAGFYSKDLILSAAWSSPTAGRLVWAAGLAGAMLTGLYTFRMIFLTFFGRPRHDAQGEPRRPGWRISVPLVVLAVLSLVGGFVDLPETLGHFAPFSDFLNTAWPVAAGAEASTGAHADLTVELRLQVGAAAASLIGVAMAYWLFLARPVRAPLHDPGAPGVAWIRRWWFAGWGFDRLYDVLLVRPLLWAVRLNRGDFIDSIYTGLAAAFERAHRIAAGTQTGQLRWYAMALAAGAVIVIAIVVLV